jgi:hypothetical protein
MVFATIIGRWKMIKKLLALIIYVPLVFIGFIIYGVFEALFMAFNEGKKIIC